MRSRSCSALPDRWRGPWCLRPEVPCHWLCSADQTFVVDIYNITGQRVATWFPRRKVLCGWLREKAAGLYLRPPCCFKFAFGTRPLKEDETLLHAIKWQSPANITIIQLFHPHDIPSEWGYRPCRNWRTLVIRLGDAGSSFGPSS
jgi:hypothetical protein